MFSPLIEELIDALRILPGVGKKSAQRIAIQLLDSHRDGGLVLAKAITDACEGVGRCQDCRTFTESSLCRICEDNSRDASVLCVVESPTDILALEQTSAFDGCYFVLMGHLSPLDGLGPEEIGIRDLLDLVKRKNVQEVILATGTTVEGEATAFFISEQLSAMNIGVSRIAHGVPIGGELGYVDGNTLAHALQGRRKL